MRRFHARLDLRERVRIDHFGMRDMVELREQRAGLAQSRRPTTSNTVPTASPGTSCSSRATRRPPSRRTSPSSGLRSPESSFSSVDLPAPLRPMSAMRSLGSMDRSTWSSSSGPPTL
jgi:hypothetical protein